MFLGIAVGRAQSTAYVFKGGPSLGTQKWDNSQRQLLFKYHAALAIETVNNEDDRSALYMQIGYHVRGSATRFRYISFNNYPGGNYSEKFEFRNLSLSIGAKQKFPMANERFRYFYFAGVRGDYTLNSNVDELQAKTNSCNTGIYPFPGGVQRWMFGLAVGGGLQFDFAELVGAQIEVSVNPDLTLQYRQPSLDNVLIGGCYGAPQQTISIPERRIKNTTLEISLGLRLLKKVVYVD